MFTPIALNGEHQWPRTKNRGQHIVELLVWVQSTVHGIVQDDANGMLARSDHQQGQDIQHGMKPHLAHDNGQCDDGPLAQQMCKTPHWPQLRQSGQFGLTHVAGNLAAGNVAAQRKCGVQSLA